MKIDLATQRYAFVALLAAALFGASTPIAKLLSGDIPPTLLAGLLYCGSGLGLMLVWGLAGRGRFGAMPRGREWAWLLAAVVAGGVLGPLLLMHGLSGTPAGTASLLLNLESVLTAAVAFVVFREAVGARVWWGALVMLLAACTLVIDPDVRFGLSVSALLVIGACMMWALDNNLTRMVSSSDAVFLAAFKGLVAGSVNVSVASGMGARWPDAGAIGAALLVGFLGYGVSLVLFIVALRHLGSARAGAHFSTGPFFGGAIAILFLGEALTLQFLVAMGLMGIATWLVLSEQHAHWHEHEEHHHEHRHVHDAHHQHEHGEDLGPAPHTHRHAHVRLAHSHAHVPDLHHRHPH